jgi:hypothetical protein
MFDLYSTIRERLKHTLRHISYLKVLCIQYTCNVIRIIYDDPKDDPRDIMECKVCKYVDGDIYSKIYNFLFKDILNV